MDFVPLQSFVPESVYLTRSELDLVPNNTHSLRRQYLTVPWLQSVQALNEESTVPSGV